MRVIPYTRVKVAKIRTIVPRLTGVKVYQLSPKFSVVTTAVMATTNWCINNASNIKRQVRRMTRGSLVFKE